MPVETHRDTEPVRCGWATGSELERRYHDVEWGVPSHDDVHLFEMITLEGAQAGLSWSTILRKREGYRRAFAGFDPGQVARFDARRVERLLADPGIVRHRGKIESTIDNARRVLEVQEAEGSLARLVWSFVGDVPRVHRRRSMSQVPSETPESRALSRELRRRGFRFVGPTTCYAFMQATGLVNDHLVRCFRHAEVGAELLTGGSARAAPSGPGSPRRRGRAAR
ncbi:MAG TPA: DNA-3-methyladenine glycosylase I [Thermoanaerobaculia bacterium]|nr:DNA-3-methyladenine glycosylase I [Thermoanaerobaculia bacterium]